MALKWYPEQFRADLEVKLAGQLYASAQVGRDIVKGMTARDTGNLIAAWCCFVLSPTGEMLASDGTDDRGKEVPRDLADFNGMLQAVIGADTSTDLDGNPESPYSRWYDQGTSKMQGRHVLASGLNAMESDFRLGIGKP